jgi:hypothetical protein
MHTTRVTHIMNTKNTARVMLTMNTMKMARQTHTMKIERLKLLLLYVEMISLLGPCPMAVVS